MLRGFDKVFQLGIPLLAIAAAGLGALELLNLWNQGELHKLFGMAASRPGLTLDLVGVRGCRAAPQLEQQGAHGVVSHSHGPIAGRLARNLPPLA